MPQEHPHRSRRGANQDDDLAKEIRAHLDLETEERVADGASENDARYAARRAFGNVLRIQEEARALWTPAWLEHLQQDVRYAVRTFGRTPGFTAIAVVTLALGIGANSAIFTVVSSVLVRPLPFPDSDRVVRIFENIPPPAAAGGAPSRVPALTLSEVKAFASQTTTLSHIGAHIPTIRTVTGRNEPARLVGARVSPSFFSMMRPSLMLGRVFELHEDGPGADAVVILSHGTWQRRFGSDPSIVGQRLDMDGRAHTIVGVMREGFVFPDPRDEFWMPLATAGPMMQQRLPVSARLKDGVSLAAALAEITALIPRLRTNSGTSNVNQSVGSNTFEVARLMDLVVAPVKEPLLLLSAAVGFVLLIACVNVTNLLFGRTASRQREMAMRAALGAGRWRLVRQALTESVLLGLLGGAAGVALGFGGVRLLRVLAASLPRRDLDPGIALPRLHEIAVDAPVLAVTLAVSLLTGVMFGLLPSIWHTGAGPIRALRQGTATAMSGFNLLRGNRLQGVLVIAEIALAMTLLVGGGLLMQSFVRLSNVNPGYDAADVLTFQVSLPPGRPARELRAVAERLVERIQTAPAVQAVGYTEALPMTRVAARYVALSSTPNTQPLRRPPAGSVPPHTPFVRFVSRDFLAAMAIPLLAGRTFDDRDRAGQPQVMLINRALARSGLFGDNPIGRHTYALGPQPWEIVGIVEDVRQASLTESVAPQIFIDYRQVPDNERIVGVGIYFCARSSGDPLSIAANLRSVLHQLDSQAMLEDVATMDQLVSNSVARPRFYAVLFGIFAAVAAVLASVGIYGVIAYAVTQRTREIGIRMALGSGRLRVMKLILAQSAALTVIGIALGLGGAALMTRYLEQLLFGLTALDLATFAGVALLFAAIALLAALIPARRAMNVDPLTALRFE